ncbi:hypothetical protein J3R30DRAFT_3447351 [Lentinula aciculospora]|uniref:F-box domain-containing protein n=1 Tax=Lentinula aciculospora TaxID=153920 RepID=A0A9W9AIB7_9AGAR|nr:hypothetical protein J3R30DRAFT_3447351 [Lentinula aciculospora]
MSKRPLSPAPLPPSKKIHLSLEISQSSSSSPSPFESLSDELILCIFARLSFADLCACQATNGNWYRLATDNELWRSLYLRTFGRPRLRGARGFVGRTDGREVKSLPGRAKVEDHKDWKWMFRISSNWKNGRCATEDLKLIQSSGVGSPKKSHMLLAGSLTITATSQSSSCPLIHLQNVAGEEYTLTCPTSHSANITSLALDQSAPSSGHIRVVAFLSSGDFRIFTVNHNHPAYSAMELSHRPLRRSTRVCPVIQAVFHHPLLITLSEAFTLSIYDLSSSSATLTQTLSSFTSFPPTSLVLSTTSVSTYRLVLAYAIPVYPAHWSVGATELIIAGPPSSSDLPHSSAFLGPAHSPMTIISTRTARALDVPQGWVDEKKLRLMREQWSRKVSRVADTQTDGKFVVIAPEDPGSRPYVSSPSSSSSSTPSSHNSLLSSTAHASSLYSPTSLQLYRLSLPSFASISSSAPKLTFVRTLHGQLGPVAALALSDGRCVSFGVNGSIWVWDLESTTGTQVAAPIDDSFDDAFELTNAKRSVGFDERRIVTAVNEYVAERRFDI